MKSKHPTKTLLRILRCRWLLPFIGVLLLSLCQGCATYPSSALKSPTRRALRPLPKVSEDAIRSDQALVGAFFSANGIQLSPDQLRNILPPSSPEGRLDRHELRRIAAKYNRQVVVVKADEGFLWEELGNNRPMLVLLPSSLRYSSSATPLIPLAWDQQERTIDLLDGHGNLQTLSQSTFFERREPLKHAALCLVKSGGLFASGIRREQKLLLADMGYNRESYRREEVVYTAIQPVDLSGENDIDRLIEHGTGLLRKGRHEEAVPVFQAALALNPDDPKILNNLAFTMMKGNGELLTALRHATKAAQLDPHNPLVLETLGSINLHVGDAPAAINFFLQAWARALRHSPEVQIAIMDQLVRAQLAAKHHDMALQVAEYRRRNFPNYRFPKDILINLPSLRRARLLSRKI